jgi:tRNA(fMet)-specific endonuclease VapC
MLLLDTDIFTHISFGKAEVLKHWEQVVKSNPKEKIYLSVITWCEAIRGRIESIIKAEDEIALTKAQSTLNATRSFLERFEIISIDDRAAKHFEQLRRQKKLKMRRGDMLVACIALANNAILVTGNIKDFQSVKGLRCQDWTRSS